MFIHEVILTASGSKYLLRRHEDRTYVTRIGDESSTGHIENQVVPTSNVHGPFPYERLTIAPHLLVSTPVVAYTRVIYKDDGTSEQEVWPWSAAPMAQGL